MILCVFCAFYCVCFFLYVTVLLPIGVMKDDVDDKNLEKVTIRYEMLF